MIRYAEEKDHPLLCRFDKHIGQSELINSIKANRCLLIFDGDAFVGWLRYNLFWDSIPFMNMLYILDEYRGKGFGRFLVYFWEKEMAKRYKTVMTSTRSDETAQYFYRKLGYSHCGYLTLPDEPLEIILTKSLRF